MAAMIVALENISYTLRYSLQTYMNMAVILVAIVGFGVIKKSGITIKLQLQHYIVSYMESIQYYFEPVLDIDNPFILTVFVVTTVLNVLKKDYKLEPLGNLDGNIEYIIAAATA